MRAKRSLDMSGHKSELESRAKTININKTDSACHGLRAPYLFELMSFTPPGRTTTPHSWSNLIGEVFVNLIMFLQTAHV